MFPDAWPRNSSKPRSVGRAPGPKPRFHLPNAAVAYPRGRRYSREDPLAQRQPVAADVLLRVELPVQPVALRVAAGEQRTARGRATWRRGVEVGTPHAVGGEAVDVRRLDLAVAVAAQVAVARRCRGRSAGRSDARRMAWPLRLRLPLRPRVSEARKRRASRRRSTRAGFAFTASILAGHGRLLMRVRTNRSTFALLILLAAPAAARAEPWKNPIVKRGYLGSPLVEVTPFVFSDRLYRLESWQKYWELPDRPPPDTRAEEDAVRVWDVEADRLVSTPLTNHGFATALVWDGRVYVFSAHWDRPNRKAGTIDMTSSADLVTWTKPVTVLRAEPSGEPLQRGGVPGRGPVRHAVRNRRPEVRALHVQVLHVARPDDLDARRRRVLRPREVRRRAGALLVRRHVLHAVPGGPRRPLGDARSRGRRTW